MIPTTLHLVTVQSVVSGGSSGQTDYKVVTWGQQW